MKTHIAMYHNIEHHSIHKSKGKGHSYIQKLSNQEGLQFLSGNGLYYFFFLFSEFMFKEEIIKIIITLYKIFYILT